jgi:hypothetical protein
VAKIKPIPPRQSGAALARLDRSMRKPEPKIKSSSARASKSLDDFDTQIKWLKSAIKKLGPVQKSILLNELAKLIHVTEEKAKDQGVDE